MAKKSTSKDTAEKSTENSNVEQATDSVSYSKCGGALKEERLKQGLSIGDICTQLRLSANQIEALEADEFSKLPQPSIVRGFIRNYAKALQIDAAPILAVYQQLNPETAPQSLTVKETADSSVINESKSGFSPVLFIALLALFALIGGGYYYYTHHTRTAVEAEETVGEEVETSASESNTTEFVLEQPVAKVETNAPATQAEESKASTDVETTTATAETQKTDATTNDTTEKTNLTLDKTADTVKPVAAEAVKKEETASQESSPAPAGFAQLAVTTTAATWVNVTNYYTGRKIYSEIVPANTTETINAKKPFKVIIGNAPNTSLSIDGEAFDLTAKTRNKVAKLSVK